MTNHKKTSVRPRSITLPGNGSSSSSGASSAADHTFTITSADGLKALIADIDIKKSTDTIVSSIDYTLPNYIENLTLTGSATLGMGNSLDNIITGNTTSGNTLNGSTGKDILIGGTGNDTYYVDNIGDQVREASTASGTSTQDIVVSSIDYTLGDTLENLTLTGSAKVGTGNSSANHIIGNSAANTLTGLGGNDTLNGGKGSDTLIGGTGDDIYHVDNSRDLIIEDLGTETGTDTVQATTNYTLAANVENLTLTAGFTIGGTGNSGVNTITGNEKINKLDGGKNTGDAGDTLIGGAGNDIYVVNNTNDTVDETTAKGGDGIDLVLSNVNYALSENVENLTLTGTNNINGTGNGLNNLIVGNSGINTLIGGAGSDKLYGGEGNDTLDGGDGTVTADQGDDMLSGGLGSDTYVIRRTSQVIKETSEKGAFDKVIAKINDYTLAANIENLTLDTGIIKGTGNSSNNTIMGNASDNTLDGGKGADTFYGYAGNDTYIVDNIGDTIYDNDNSASLANAGTDLVESSISYTLGQFLENLTLTGKSSINGTGNGLSNTITGNDGNNIIDGGKNIAGNTDTLVGGLGNDTYAVYALSDVIITEGTETKAGTDDTIIANINNYTLSAANVENLTLGSVVTNNAETILNGTGSSAANTITGNDANNTLNGGKNTDNTVGDILIGGKGNDTYIVNQAKDKIIEDEEEGTADLVQSSISYSLGQNIENLTLTGTDNINGTGNTLNNIITGNSGSNILTGGTSNDKLIGGAGSDTLIGGQGDDTLYGGSTTDESTSAADTYIYNLGDGNDTIVEFGTNTAEDKIIFGSSIKQVDVSFEKSGTDLTFNIKNKAAITVKDWFSGTAHYIEKAQFSDGSSWDLSKIQINETIGSTASALTGWIGDDTLTGDTRANTLDGAAGNDTLSGKAGNDNLSGGAGNDSYLFAFNSTASSGDGIDTIIETGGADSLILSNATSSQLWFYKNANNLEVTRIGNIADKVIIKDWYTTTANTDYRVDTFKGSDNKMLTLTTQVIGLIDAMASITTAPGTIPTTAGATKTAYDNLIAAWTGP